MAVVAVCAWARGSDEGMEVPLQPRLRAGGNRMERIYGEAEETE